MKKYFTFFFVLLIPIAFLFYDLHCKYKIIKEQSMRLNNIEFSNRNMKNTIYEYAFFDSFKVKESIKTKKGILYLKDVVKSETLIIRIKEDYCESCINRELYNIGSMFGEEMRVIVLSNFENLRTLNILLNKYKLNYLVYNLDYGECVFENKCDLSGIFMFIVNGDLIAGNFYIPIQNENELSTNYLQYISHKIK